jgi:hypothetical protein
MDRLRLTVHWQDEDKGGEAAGRGLLAEVEDDDGSQVLVWLR